MLIEVLRLSHRLPRDCRISTHCALVSRAFGASKLYYSGMHDSSLEESVSKIVDRFGGPFAIEYAKNGEKLVKEKKKEEFTIVHLTMYGLPFEKECKKIRKSRNKILLIVGGKKVEGFFYEIADYNIAVGSQPHSEVAALALALNELHGSKNEFEKARIRVIPCKKGKNVESL